MKKSLYLFLSALLGIVLFFMLHRILVFMYVYLSSSQYEYVSLGLSYYQFLALDYITLFFTLLAGAWYGIWLGLYWYDGVYVSGSHGGLVDHLSRHYWPGSSKAATFETKVEQAKEHLERNLYELEDLAKDIKVIAQQPSPIKKRIVRKRAPKV